MPAIRATAAAVPGTFAFLVHPRTDLAADLARLWRPLGRVPGSLYDTCLRRLPLPPLTVAAVHLREQTAPIGHVVVVPFGARHLLADPVEGRRRVGQAVDRAAALGAHVVGLGALTATVTGGGAALRDRAEIGVTNGNAFTAAIVDDQVRSLLGGAVGGRGGRHVAVVGATGSVGATVARLLAEDRAVDRLTLVARSRERLHRLAAEVGRRVPAAVATDLHAVRHADVVVLLTASADALLRPEHLGDGSLVLDATQPRNTSPDLGVARPDVTVVDGGLVEIPSLRLRGANIGLPSGRAYACFAETALLARSGHRGHFSIGVPTLEQVAYVRALAREHRPLGFAAASPTSFGEPVGPRAVAAASPQPRAA